MSYIEVDMEKKVICPLCKEPLTHFVNYRNFNGIPDFAKKLLRDDRFFSEKLVCGCEESVEYFHNIIPTFRLINFKRLDEKKQIRKHSTMEGDVVYAVKELRRILK